jgi:chemotaxis protein MotC
VRARRAALVFALASLALAAASPACAQSIAAMAADLQALQAKIAAGDKAAYAAQPEKLVAIAAAIAAAKPETWRSKRETDAVAIYLFSGGGAREAVQLLQTGAVPPSETTLMRGAIAYVVGNESDAASLLGGLDPRKLGLAVAGPIAYAQAVLATAKEPAKAIALLDYARLLTPGGLVEEASLRREILLAAESRDVDRVASLGRQYATRFGHSIYADGFIPGAAAAIVDGALVDDVAKFQKFHIFIASLAPEVRRAFLLTIARAETLAGKPAVAAAAAADALNGAQPDSPDEARAKLYEGAARILTPDYDAGLAELQAIAPAKLDRRDQPLLEAARAVAAYLRAPPAADAAPATGAAPDQGDDEAAKTIALAEAALDRTAPMAGVVGKGNP